MTSLSNFGEPQPSTSKQSNEEDAENERQQCITLIRNALTGPSYPTDERLSKAMAIYKAHRCLLAPLDTLVEVLLETKRKLFAVELEKLVLADMRSLHATDERFHHVVAMRELNGERAYGADYERQKFSPIACLRRCRKVYMEAVREMGTRTMWTFYLTGMMRAYHLMVRVSQRQRFRMVDEAFKGTRQLFRVSVSVYKRYVDIMNKNHSANAQLVGTIERAIDQHNHLDLWLKLFEHYLRRDNVRMVIRTAKRARIYMPKDKDQVKIRQLCTGALYAMQGTHNCAKLRYEAKLLTGHKGRISKYWYLAASVYGTKSMVQFYTLLCQHDRVTLDIYEQLYEFEARRNITLVDHWRYINELAIEAMGAGQPKVWQMAHQFESTHGTRKLATAVRRRAEQQLAAVHRPVDYSVRFTRASRRYRQVLNAEMKMALRNSSPFAVK